MRDILSVVNVTLNKNRTYNRVYGSREYTSSCPWCHGTNRFHLYPDCNDIPGVGPLGYFECMDSSKGRAGCGRKGDMLSYLEQQHGLNFIQACQHLDIDPHLIITYRRANKGLAPVTYRPREKAHAETSDDWRVTAHALSRNAAAYLLSQKEEPFEYLLGRGLTEVTIQRARLGYYPQYKIVKGDLWGYPGKRLLLPRGIVIPWFDALGNVVCIRFRRLPSDESDEARKYYGVDAKTGEINRYKALRGVSSAYLYGSDRVVNGEPVALFEGEIDALIAGQAEVCPCVATGSTGWAHSEEALSLLAGCRKVLVCFDNDPNNAGERASQFWLAELSNAVRHRPYWSDANALALAGVHIKAWLELAVEEDTLTCADCGMDDDAVPEEAIFSYDETGRSYCPTCWGKRQLSPGVLEGSRYDQFLEVVQQIASAWPGRCEIHVDPGK